MTSDLEFLDEVSAFLSLEPLAGRKSVEDGVSGRPGDEEAISESIPGADSLSDDTDESLKSEQYSTRKSNRRSETADTRRQKYRMRAKNEREGLRRAVSEMSTRIQNLISAREGRDTTARTDLVLSKTFWRTAASYQREQRLRVEAEHKRLSAIVNAQNMYIESFGVHKDVSESTELTLAPSKRLATVEHNHIDDVKWLRLKSSVSSLYTTYLHEVDKCYAQVDQIFQDIEMESFTVGPPDTSYRFNSNGDVKYFQHRNRLLLPFNYETSCRIVWELVPLVHHQIDREVYHGVSDPETTVGLQFRLQKTSTSGKIMSIMKHQVCRRFVESDRVVMVWRIFSEGEADFSGLDVDETSYAIIRPVHDGSQKKTSMEFYSRQIPGLTLFWIVYGTDLI
ncbi:hypothetical protein DVH05_000296 [Phytophthora capsici]|nr:hypothetical protein DVH05_000296 [Phytophthora capsici]